MKEYSLKQLEKAKQLSCEKLDNTPLVVPVDMTQPETYNEAIARILHHSGVISSDDYAKLRGNVFDFDGDDEDWSDDDFDDDVENFSMPLSSYEEFDYPPSPSEAPSSAGNGTTAVPSPDGAVALPTGNPVPSDDKGQPSLPGVPTEPEVPLRDKALASSTITT